MVYQPIIRSDRLKSSNSPSCCTDSWSHTEELASTFRDQLPISSHLMIAEHYMENFSSAHYIRCTAKEVFRVAELSGWCMCLYHATLSLRNDLVPEWMRRCGLYKDKTKKKRKNYQIARHSPSFLTALQFPNALNRHVTKLMWHKGRST